MSLTREDLDKMQCANPDCDHTGHDGLVFHSQCHPDWPTWVEYKDGLVRVTCSHCDRHIATVQVASHAQ